MPRVYLDDKGEKFCLVDEEDYAWALRWRWVAHPSKQGLKFYASRSTRLHGRSGPQTRIYMHKEILERAGVEVPSALHTIGDHLNGDSLDNQRHNLLWATASENNRNRFGRRVREPKFDLSPTHDTPPF